MMITKVLEAAGLTAITGLQIDETEFLKDVILKETDEHFEVDTYLVLSRYLDALMKQAKKPSFNSDITHKELVERYSYNQATGIFVNNRTGFECGSTKGRKDDYIKIKIDTVTYAAHRLAWFYMTKQWPREYIDHINHDKRDNRIANLRCVSASENAHNRTPRKNGSGSSIAGVTYCTTYNKWRVVLTFDYVRKHFGYFKTQLEAEAVALDRRRALYAGNTI